MATSSSAAHQGADVGVGVGATFLLENACLDLFLLDLHAPPRQLRGLLAAAWDQDALTALRLVCHRRGVPRQAGESVAQREGFLTAALWMLQNHPHTLAANVAAFADFGYIHDFPELLHRLVVAHDAAQVRPPGRKRARDADAVAVPAATSVSVPLAVADPAATSSSVPLTVAVPAATLPLAVADPAATSSSAPLAVTDPAAATTSSAVADPAATSSSAPLANTSSAAATTQPFGYQILFNAILDFFVGHLRSDLDNLLLRNGMISLAAKWCSSMDSALDQTRLLQKDIVERLFPDDCIGAVTDRHLLGLLRRNVVVPLIKALEKQPQPQSSSSQSRARLPHQIVDNFAEENWVKKSDTARNRITEEWRSMVEGLRARACLSNCIAVCDMSRGSDDLSRLQVQVCVALGMLIPELSDHPWNNWVHVFSRNTTSTIPISSFATYTDKAAAIWEKKQCEDRFNLTRVFQWVLLVALEEKVVPKDMVKNIIVLTGRDFDQASVAPSLLLRPEDMKPKAFDPTHQRRWRDEYRIIKDMFHEHGFGEHVPGVVFWNLRGEPRSPALTWTKDGVLGLSGYSDDLMRLFLDKSGVVEPDDEMYAAISAEEYHKLKTD